MTTEVRIPALGFSTKESTLAEFLVADGERVQKGQPLYALELDKSVQEVEAPAAGVLKILREAGNVYPVGELIAEIV